jgi:hypothetical protein
VSAVSECGSNQVNETLSRSSCDQSAKENDLLEPDGAPADRLLVRTVKQQESRTKTATSMGRERGSVTNNVAALDRTSVEIDMSTHRKEPRMSDDNTDDALRPHVCLHVKTGRTENGCAEPLQENLSGSIGMASRVIVGRSADSIGNPIPIDDDESPNQSTTGPIFADNDVGNSEEDRRTTIQSLSRPMRKNRKRKYSDMQLWGDVEFERQVLNELHSTWNIVKICWNHIEALVSRLKDHNRHPQSSVMELIVALYSFWMKWEKSSSIDQASLLEIIECCKKVRAQLEARKAMEKGEEEDRLLEFEQALNELAIQATLCDSIEEYPSSIDRKDDDQDKEYGKARRASKTRCCRKGLP